MEVFVATLKCVRRGLHLATPQDIAKFASAVSVAWPLVDHLQDEILKPCFVDIAQAVRFDCESLNSQDLSLIVSAFAKHSFIDKVVVDILVEQVVAKITRFSNSDLCRLLSCAPHSTSIPESCTKAALEEIETR